MTGEAQCLKIRIAPGATERVVEFLRELSDREDEVQGSLRREGILAESLFLERGDDADHLFFYTWAEDLEAAAGAFEESTAPLDLETKRWIEETWDEVRALQPMMHQHRRGLVPAEVPGQGDRPESGVREAPGGADRSRER